MSDEHDRDDDPDREAILARRRRFIAVALAGLAGTAGCGDDAAVEPDPQQQSQEQTTEESGATLEPHEPKVDPGDEQNTAAAGEDPSTGTGAGVEPTEGAATGEADPQPCLSVARPQPCLRRAAPSMREPAPQPCLDVAAPRDEPPAPPPQVCLTPPRKPDGEDV